MLKFFILTLLFILPFCNYSQEENNQERDAFFGEYNISKINKEIIIDDETFITSASVTEKGLVKMAVFITNIDNENNTYKTDKLDISHNEAYNLQDGFFKLKNVIYNIRAEKVKKEIFYYIDEIKNNKIIKSDNPFFKGFEKDGYSAWIKKATTTSKHLYISIDLSDYKHHPSTINILKFDINNFQFLNKNSILLPTNKFVPQIQYFEKNFEDQYFLMYNYLDYTDKKEKIKIIHDDNNTLKEIIIESKSNDYTLINQKNNLVLYTLTKNTNELSISLYEIDVKNSTYSEIKTQPISQKIIDKEYNKNSNQYEKKFKYYSLTNSIKVKKDIDNNIYIFSYLGTNFYYDYSGKYSNDIIITKISNENIEWNQFIRRSIRNELIDLFSTPFIKITDDNIILRDFENPKYLNSNGSFNINTEDERFFSNFSEISITIDKLNGNFNRKLK